MEDVRFYKEQTEVLISLNTAESSCFAYSSESTPTSSATPSHLCRGLAASVQASSDTTHLE